MDEILESFRGHAVPEHLSRLWELQRELEVDYAGNFELIAGGARAALAWFAGRSELADQFLVFGTDGMGSLYGFWLYPGRTVENAPVVYLNGEGCDNAVLASTLDDFLALLTLDRDDPGMLGLWGDRLQPTAGHERYVAWLKETCGVSPPEDAERLVKEAGGAHPDLDAWVEDVLAP